jgi:co-chaperonin GroES (HSP10)
MSIQVVDMASTEFQPKNDFLLVKPDKMVTEKVSEGGIIMVKEQTSVTDRPTLGKVVALGQDIDDIKVNDMVLWPNTDGINFEFNDGEFLLLRYKSIIGMKV